jgi:ABC-2 type transport system permease protein
MFSIFKKEIHQFFSSLTGYITIILFLLVNGIFLFVLKDSNIFDLGYATLDRFFELAPWILMFLIPAITMRILADEYKTGTFEILRTRPVTRWQIIGGKYIALLIIILFVLLPTVVYIFTIKSLASLGDIDSGGLAGSYIGLTFLAIVFAAIGICCSGFSNNAVVAFLISAFACLLLYFGFSSLSKLPAFQGKADYYIEMLGIDFHYRSISRGVVDSRDIIYFLSIIYLFLLLAVKNLDKGRSLSRKSLWWLPVLGILIFVNILAANFHTRVDLTNEKRFTISSPVKKLINKLDDVVTIDVFLKGEMPAIFKGVANYSNDLLQEFREIGKSKIQYHFIDPTEQMEGSERTWSDTLNSLGLSAINLKVQLKAGEQSQYIYPAAIVHYRDRLQPVSLYEGNNPNLSYSDLNSMEALMEFRFANAINKITETVKPVVGYSIGNGEPMGDNVYDLAENVLKKDYSLFAVNINKQPVIPDTFKMLLIVKPSIAFSEDEKIKIDQYIMRGGKVMWLVDKLNAEMDSLRLKNQVVAFDRSLNLDDMLFRYGIRINNDLIMDLQCDYLPFDVNGNGQFSFLHWNYFPLFESNSNHVINKNLGLVAGRFVNSIDTVKAENITKTILLSSSSNSRTISSPAIISGEENKNAPENEMFKRQNIPAAVLLEGKFTSAFANRVTKAMLDTLNKYNYSFLPSSLGENKMIVVADGDIALNGVSQKQPLPMGVNPFTIGSQYEYQFANRDFIENCIQYLVNDNGLTEAKAKDYTVRLFDPKKIEGQRLIWQLINIILPILLVILFGFIYQFLRQRKYQHS